MRAPRRAGRWLLAAAGFCGFAGLVVLAALPTGADDPEGVVPPGARLAARAPVDDAWVFVVADAGRLRAQVAYRGPKGWLDVLLDHTGDDLVAARASTEGAGPLPALTAVFGRAAGARVAVRWADGRTNDVEPASDGTWLAARPGSLAVDVVTIERDGVVLAEVHDL